MPDADPAYRLPTLLRALLADGLAVELPATGTSMRPTIGDGETLWIEAVGEPRLGDVVVVDLGDDGLLVHRVIARRAGELRLRGDARDRDDGWWPSSRVLGRVVAAGTAGSRRRGGLARWGAALALLSRLGLLHRLARRWRRRGDRAPAVGQRADHVEDLSIAPEVELVRR